MAEHVVNDEILNNMGSLEGYLKERAYTVATVPMQGETIVRNEFGPDANPIASDPFNAVPGVAPQGGMGVVPQTAPPAQPVQQPVVRQSVAPQQPQISMEQYQAALAYAQQQRQAAEEAETARREAEDQRFLDSINHLPQVQQDREILIRYNKQLEEAFLAQQRREQQTVEQREEEEQLEAKHQVAWTLAMKNRLPWENPGVQAALMAAPDRRTMDSIVSGLASYQPIVQATQTPAQVAAQVVAAPGRGGGGRSQSAVKPHSGDIEGYLKSKPYMIV